MLVLARKKNQSIVINDNIEIFVVDVSHDQVKIGIKAPREVTVHRKEVYDNIKSEMTQAQVGPADLKKLEALKLKSINETFKKPTDDDKK